MRWGIPQQALAELALCSIVEPDADALSGMDKTEAYVSSAVRLEAPTKGVYLWRNNVGAGVVANVSELCPECRMRARRVIRWGLANDSSKLNERMKSADLIGIKRTLITAEMVGTFIGKFYSRECKREDWTFRGTLEDNAQLAWAILINAQGGDAKIVRATGSL